MVVHLTTNKWDDLRFGVKCDDVSSGGSRFSNNSNMLKSNSNLCLVGS